MSQFRIVPRLFRTALVSGLFATLTGAWMVVAPAQLTARLEAIVRLTEVGIVRASGADSAAAVSIIVYASGPARIGLAGADLSPLPDTIRLSSLPAITADVSSSDVHIRLLSAGRLRVGGDVTGGRAIHLTATGRHIVLLKGGVGATTITDPE